MIPYMCIDAYTYLKKESSYLTACPTGRAHPTPTRSAFLRRSLSSATTSLPSNPLCTASTKAVKCSLIPSRSIEYRDHRPSFRSLRKPALYKTLRFREALVCEISRACITSQTQHSLSRSRFKILSLVSSDRALKALVKSRIALFLCISKYAHQHLLIIYLMSIRINLNNLIICIFMRI